MAQAMTFWIGADASCTDGACGQVSRIIVNPVTREVTHLAVDPNSGMARGGLFPLTLWTLRRARSGFAALWLSSRRSGPPRRPRAGRTSTPPGKGTQTTPLTR